jgi:hypothetical protein
MYGKGATIEKDGAPFLIKERKNSHENRIYN